MDPPNLGRPSALPMFQPPAEPVPVPAPPATTAPVGESRPGASVRVPAQRDGLLPKVLRPSQGPSSAPATSEAGDVPGEPPRGTTSTDPGGHGVLSRWRRRYAPGGEPAEVKEFLGFLLVAGIGLAGLALRRSARTLRQPTKREQDAIAEPLARIAVRHLPMHMLGPDLLDITKAAAGVSQYVNAGPMIVPAATSGAIHREEHP